MDYPKVFNEIRSVLDCLTPEYTYYLKAVKKYAYECIDIMEDHANSKYNKGINDVFCVGTICKHNFLDEFIRYHHTSYICKYFIIHSAIDQTWRGCSSFDFENNKIAECLAPSKRTNSNINDFIENGYTKLLVRSVYKVDDAIKTVLDIDIYQNDVQNFYLDLTRLNDIKALKGIATYHGIKEYLSDEQLKHIAAL